MALMVQKYGGTSVGSVERIALVAARVLKTVKAGNSVVVVVSAMGNHRSSTRQISPQFLPSRREMDMLLSTGEQVSIALEYGIALGQPISLTGTVGIVTRQNTPALGSAYPTNRFHGTSRIIKWLW